MTFEIHYTVAGREDCFVVEGATLEIVRDKVSAEMEKRGLDAGQNLMWSKELPQ